MGDFFPDNDNYGGMWDCRFRGDEGKTLAVGKMKTKGKRNGRNVPMKTIHDEDEFAVTCAAYN